MERKDKSYDKESLLDFEMAQYRVAYFLHNSSSGIIVLIHSMSKAHQSE